MSDIFALLTLSTSCYLHRRMLFELTRRKYRTSDIRSLFSLSEQKYTLRTSNLVLFAVISTILMLLSFFSCACIGIFCQEVWATTTSNKYNLSNLSSIAVDVSSLENTESYLQALQPVSYPRQLLELNHAEVKETNQESHVQSSGRLPMGRILFGDSSMVRPYSNHESRKNGDVSRQLALESDQDDPSGTSKDKVYNRTTDEGANQEKSTDKPSQTTADGSSKGKNADKEKPGDKSAEEPVKKGDSSDKSSLKVNSVNKEQKTTGFTPFAPKDYSSFVITDCSDDAKVVKMQKYLYYYTQLGLLLKSGEVTEAQFRIINKYGYQINYLLYSLVIYLITALFFVPLWIAHFIVKSSNSTKTSIETPGTDIIEEASGEKSTRLTVTSNSFMSASNSANVTQRLVSRPLMNEAFKYLAYGSILFYLFIMIFDVQWIIRGGLDEIRDIVIGLCNPILLYRTIDCFLILGHLITISFTETFVVYWFYSGLPSASLDKATHVVITKEYTPSSNATLFANYLRLPKVELVEISTRRGMRVFYHDCVMYVENQDKGAFSHAGSFPIHAAEVLSVLKDGSDLDRPTMSDNKMVLPQQTLLELSLKRLAKMDMILTFDMAIWYILYYMHALTVLWTIAATVIFLVDVSTVWKAQQELSLRMSLPDTTELVRQKGEWVCIDSSELQVGDIIAIRPNTVAPADILLLKGDVVVNEFALTGETVPVRKVVVGSDRIKPIKSSLADSSYIIFRGADVEDITSASSGKTDLMTESQFLNTCHGARTPLLPPDLKVAYGVVLAVGSGTLKGQLTRLVLFAPDIPTLFQLDIVNLGLLVAFISAAISCYPAIYHSKYGFIPLGTMTSLIACFNGICTGIPSFIFKSGCKRLERGPHQISVAEPKYLFHCAAVNTIVLDKTGTLTEDSIEMRGYYSPEWQKHCVEESEVPGSLALNQFNLLSEYEAIGLASCHSVRQYNGDYHGSHLEIDMLKSVNADITTADTINVRGLSLTPLKCFEFDNVSCTQGVIVRVDPRGERSGKHVPKNMEQYCVDPAQPLENIHIYFKGSPSSIVDLCQLENDLEINKRISQYALKGYYVLAMCSLPLSAVPNSILDQTGFDLSTLKSGTPLEIQQSQEIIAAELERSSLLQLEYKFLGLLVYKNSLRPTSQKAIKELQGADIECIMCTGDNCLAGLNIALQCNIMDPSKPTILGELVDSTEVSRASRLLASIYDTPLLDECETNLGMNIDDSSVMDSSQLKKPLINNNNIMLMQNEISKIMWKCIDNNRTVCSSEVFKNPAAFNIAIDNNVFRMLVERDPINLRVLRPLVFGSMKPNDKLELVCFYKDSCNQIVGMCGDGENDTAALQVANMGVTLSSSTSKTIARFSSSVKSVACLPELILEGKCMQHSITSYTYFAYMSSILFAFARALSFLFTISFLPIEGQLAGDIMYLLVALTMGYNQPRTSLTSLKPCSRLLTRRVLYLLIGISVIFLAQIVIYQLRINSRVGDTKFTFLDVYLQFGADPEDTHNKAPSFISNHIYFALLAIMPILALVFSLGGGYMKGILSNKPLLISSVFFLACIYCACTMRDTVINLLFTLNISQQRLADAQPYIKWLCPMGSKYLMLNEDCIFEKQPFITTTKEYFQFHNITSGYDFPVVNGKPEITPHSYTPRSLVVYVSPFVNLLRYWSLGLQIGFSFLLFMLEGVKYWGSFLPKPIRLWMKQPDFYPEIGY